MILTAIFLILGAINIYLFGITRKQKTVIISLRGLDGINQNIISKLKRENEAKEKQSQSLRHRKPVVKTIKETTV